MVKVESNNVQKPTTPSDLIQYRDVNDILTFETKCVIAGGDAATADNYPVFYIAMAPCFFLEAKLRHGQDSTSGTVDIEKLTDGVAVGSGTSVISGVFDISAGADTFQSRTAVISSIKTTNLNPGDSLALKPAGTLTNASNIVVAVLLGMNSKDVPTGPNI